MLDSLLGTPLYHGLLGMLCGVVGFRLGWRVGLRVLLPVIQALFGFFPFLLSWHGGGLIAGVIALFGWALGVTLVSILTFKRNRDRIDARVFNARPYRESMLTWLTTGRGPESQPGRTALRHLVELALYLAAAFASANLLSLAMGAVLLNYMNAYVASLLAVARDPWTVRLLAWNGWSIVRVAAYILLGAAAAVPLAGRFGFDAPPAHQQWLWAMGGLGVVLDLVLKLALSRTCGRLLGAAVDLGPAAEPGPGAGRPD